MPPRRINLKVERTTEQVAGKFVPIVTAHCDDCDASTLIRVNKRVGDLPDEVIIKKFHQQGWLVDRRHALCPIHNGKPRRTNDNEVPIRTTPLPVYPFHTPAEFEAYALRGQTFGAAPQEPLDIALPPFPDYTQEEPAMATETIRLDQLAEVRKPDRETKRKINDAIGGAWDDSRGRYLANNSDELIARDLSVPRAWVEDIREEFYGDSGGNAEMDDFAKVLDEKIKAVEKLYTTAIEVADKYGKIVDEMKALRTRLQRVEAQVLPRR